MNRHLYILLCATMIIFSCSDESDLSDYQVVEFGFDSVAANYAVKKGSTLSFECKGAQSMDLIELYVNGDKMESWINPSVSVFESTISLGLGIYSMEIRGYQKSKVIAADGRNLIVNASHAPEDLSIEFISSHPHNPTNFT